MAGAGAAAAVEEDLVADYELRPGERLVPWQECAGMWEAMVGRGRAENHDAIMAVLRQRPLPQGVFLFRGWLMASDRAREPLVPVYQVGEEGENASAVNLYDRIYLARLVHQAFWLQRLFRAYDASQRRGVLPPPLLPRAPALEIASDPDPLPPRTRGRPPANAPKPPVTPVDRFALFRFTVDVDVSLPLDMGVMGDGELWRAGDQPLDVREPDERVDARGRAAAPSFVPPAQIQTVMDVCRMATYVMRACVQEVDPGDSDRVWDTVAVSTEVVADVGAPRVSFVRFTWPKIVCSSVEEYGTLYRAFVFRFRERILSVAGAETGDGELDAMASLVVEDRHDDDPDDEDYRPSPGAGAGLFRAARAPGPVRDGGLVWAARSAIAAVPAAAVVRRRIFHSRRSLPGCSARIFTGSQPVRDGAAVRPS